MVTMRAKMSVNGVDEVRSDADGEKYGEELRFDAVCSGDSGEFDENGYNENNSFAHWTPIAQLSMTVNNPDLWGKFKVGDEFYLDFTKAE